MSGRPTTAVMPPAESSTRRRLLGWLFSGALGIGALGLATASPALAQGHTGGGGSGGDSGEEGKTHGTPGGGGDDEAGKAQGRTPQQRAMRHRQRTGKTLGGGESDTGHTGHGGHEGDTTVDMTDLPSELSEGSIAGGSTGAEHFVHNSPGYWGVDGKILRR